MVPLMHIDGYMRTKKKGAHQRDDGAETTNSNTLEIENVTTPINSNSRDPLHTTHIETYRLTSLGPEAFHHKLP